MNRLLMILIALTLTPSLSKADDYQLAKDKEWEAFYAQSGMKVEVDLMSKRLDDLYLQPFEKKYVPNFVMKYGVPVYFLENAVITQQIVIKWEF
jgi:hypothetical protein